ncbi:glutathione S-transferase family protein [Novosphingobium aquimarinum]|uniref:glutathione S-transferase family protein n=1 Tax=Novosphingobium aquimarinum TaxID=2682494 RepID=UPI0012EC431A|nr:glutathione S-transferase family protein [Novosphingobium aquimarinum]
MPIDPDAPIEITAFEWVPPFAQGFVRDLRPRWACEELGLAYRERLISAMDRPEWYYSDQPWGQVPYLRDGDAEMFESGAILMHLAEGTALLPSDRSARATVMSWLFAALNSVEPMVFELSNVDIFSRQEEWAKLRRPSLVEALGGRLDRLDDALGERDWLAGPFSIADIAMITVLREIGKTDLLTARPALSAYLERGIARPAFQTALADQLRVFQQHAPKQPEGV